MTAPNNTERSLVRKMNEIKKEIGYLQKKGRNTQQKYNYVEEIDVIEAVRDRMIERNLMIFPETDELIVTPSGNTSGGAQKNLTTVKMIFTLEDGDSGETRKISMGGQGIDPGDKGVYKATTGANKYALMKLFQLSTGDDPEVDGDNSHQNPQGAPQQQRNQKPYQNRQQQQNSTQQPQNNPFAKIEGMAMELGYTFEQFMTLINALRAKNHEQPVGNFMELDNKWVLAVQGVLQKRLNKKGGQA